MAKDDVSFFILFGKLFWLFSFYHFYWFFYAFCTMYTLHPLFFFFLQFFKAFLVLKLEILQCFFLSVVAKSSDFRESSLTILLDVAISIPTYKDIKEVFLSHMYIAYMHKALRRCAWISRIFVYCCLCQTQCLTESIVSNMCPRSLHFMFFSSIWILSVSSGLKQ